MTGICGESSVSVCSGVGDKVLETQSINKSLPAPDTYPVRVFVNITYNITDCPTTESDCGSNFFLRVKDDNNKTLIEDNLNSSDHFRVNFDLSPNQTKNFRLLLVSSQDSGCITVSRVLVYRNECPGHERVPGDLVRRPSVQAPVSGSVPVTSSSCAENANYTEHSQPQDLVCTAEGKWLNDGTNCQCNQGYYKDGTVCRGMFYSMEHWCH